jgi:type VI protein secretion system component VasK
LTAADVTKLFQPVQITTPPDKPVLVSEANQGYVNGLRGLQLALDALSRVSEAEKQSAVPAAQQALAQAKQGHASLADKFADTGNQGLNTQLAELFMEPIQLADRVIPRNFGVLVTGQKNGELRQLCTALAPTFSKYPFNPLNSRTDMEANLGDIAKVFAPTTGAIWAFYQKSLAELVVRQGDAWVPAAPKPRVAPDLLRFLNRAQTVTSVFYPSGTNMMQVQVKYTLRPLQGPPIRLRLDGKEMNTSVSQLRTDFVWPAPVGQTGGAKGELISSSFSSGFGQYDGLWGVFRLFQNADDRVLGDKKVQWSRVRGTGGAAVQPINPPVQLEFIDFPGGNDLFNPKFFEELHCPTQAVIPE